jgi:hypothetical protein
MPRRATRGANARRDAIRRAIVAMFVDNNRCGGVEMDVVNERSKPDPWQKWLYHVCLSEGGLGTGLILDRGCWPIGSREIVI